MRPASADKPKHRRGVAQPGSALAWGARGRRFESFRPDQIKRRGSVTYEHWPFFVSDAVAKHFQYCCKTQPVILLKSRSATASVHTTSS